MENQMAAEANQKTVVDQSLLADQSTVEAGNVAQQHLVYHLVVEMDRELVVESRHCRGRRWKAVTKVLDEPFQPLRAARYLPPSHQQHFQEMRHWLYLLSWPSFAQYVPGDELVVLPWSPSI